MQSIVVPLNASARPIRDSAPYDAVDAYIPPALIPNLLFALTLIPMLGKMRGYLRLFNPDVSWIALICSSFAGIWTFLRTILILQTLRKSQVSKA